MFDKVKLVECKVFIEYLSCNNCGAVMDYKPQTTRPPYQYKCCRCDNTQFSDILYPRQIIEEIPKI